VGALGRHTEDGAVEIDNNFAERLVKLPAIGRNNWLFVGNEHGGHRAAILLSLIASAEYCEVQTWAWLNAVISELPKWLTSTTGPPDLADLLPDIWLKNHFAHRWKIDNIRKVERQRSKSQKTNFTSRLVLLPHQSSHISCIARSGSPFDNRLQEIV